MRTFTKILVFTFLCSVIAYTKPMDFGDKLKKLATEWHDICTDVTGVTEEMIIQARSGNFTNDTRMKRYVLCLCRVSRLMDRNMNIDMDATKKLLPEQAIKHHYSKELGECLIDAKNSDKENFEKSYQLIQCVYKKDPENFIIF